MTQNVCECQKKKPQSHRFDYYDITAYANRAFIQATINQINLRMRAQLGGWLNREFVTTFTDMFEKLTVKFPEHMLYSSHEVMGGECTISDAFITQGKEKIGIYFVDGRPDSVIDSMQEISSLDDLPSDFIATGFLSGGEDSLLPHLRKLEPFAYKTGWVILPSLRASGQKVSDAQGVAIMRFEIERARQIWTVTPPGQDVKIPNVEMVVAVMSAFKTAD